LAIQRVFYELAQRVSGVARIEWLIGARAWLNEKDRVESVIAKKPKASARPIGAGLGDDVEGCAASPNSAE
jgi:hypothetical protein